MANQRFCTKCSAAYVDDIKRCECVEGVDAIRTVEQALKFADAMKGKGHNRRRYDSALEILAAEVRRLTKQIDEIARAADSLGEFIQERAG